MWLSGRDTPTDHQESKQEFKPNQSRILLALRSIVSGRRWEILGGALLILFLIRTAWCSEDAFIAFRVVANFLSGRGLTWNVGDRVQAYTDPLYEFLIIAATLITRDPYWSSIAVSLLLSISTYFFLMRDRHGLAILMGTVILLNAKGFMDFSVSGLENPATHMAIVAFVFLYWRNKDPFWLTLIAALAAVNRMDSVLLFVPSLLHLYYRTGWRVWKPALLGTTPFLAWEAFSIFYYGFPFPNTAYAKLNTGIPPKELALQGLHYIQNAIAWDTVTVSTILGGTAVGLMGEDWPLALGACLSMIYVVRIGGDYMAGRFLTPAFVLCCAILIQHAPRKMRDVLMISGVALLVGILLPSPPLLTTRNFGGWGTDAPPDYRGVNDERALLYHGSGLLKWHQGILWPDDQWVRIGVQWRDEGIRFRELNNIGMIPYFAGPNVSFYDSGGLADALTARLPMKPGPWRTGHYWREPPAGYIDTIKTGVNQIRDPKLREYYEHLRKITRGDLWDPSRWKEIVLMNCGAYNNLLPQNRPR